MRFYKTIKKQVEDQVRCDICDTNCTTEQLGSEYATLSACWGYNSLKDETTYEIHLCETCFDKNIEWMKKQRKKFLGCFIYPYEADPLKGQTYPIV